MTLTIYWWMVPAGMVLAAFGVWWHGAQQPGMFGGMTQFFVGCGLLLGAVAFALGRLFQ